MRILLASLFTASALAEPLGRLQQRQLNPSQQSACSISYTSKCTAAAQITSARTFCASLGFGTTISTSSTVSTIKRTVFSTFTVYTSTSTVIAPTATTVSATSVRTSVTTQTSVVNSTITTSTVTIPITGTIDSCPTYTPPASQQPSGSPDVPDSTPTSTPSSNNAFRLTDNGCATPSPTVFTVSNIAYTYEYCITASIAPDSVNINTAGSLQGCAAICGSNANCVAFNYANPSNCRTVTQRPTTVAREFAVWTGYNLLSTSAIAQAALARSEPSPMGAMQEKRQAAPLKPSCLKAANAAQTTAACNCVIPSSTVTLTETISSSTTSIRTISTTKSLISTITSTPTVTSTLLRTTTLTRTRTSTSLFSVAATTSSTVSWTVATPPALFYIADADLAFAEWPADADEIFYHVQYDFDTSDDPYSPTVFTLSNSTSLSVADIIDNNVDPAAEGYIVVGQAQSDAEGGTQGYSIVALDGNDVGRLERPVCRIEGSQEGRCPLRCEIGGFAVNVRDADGLWSLARQDGDGGEGFVNYALGVGDDGGDGEGEGEV